MGHTVGVSPLTVVLGILIGAILYGLPGAFLAVPVAGAIQVIVAHAVGMEDAEQAAVHGPAVAREAAAEAAAGAAVRAPAGEEAEAARDAAVEALEGERRPTRAAGAGCRARRAHIRRGEGRVARDERRQSLAPHPSSLSTRQSRMPRRAAPSRSLFIIEMKSMLISFGQTASHSPMLVQAPNPSASICLTIRATRLYRSGWPCGSRFRWPTLAAVNSIAEAFGQAATQAPQPMQVAASIARSAFGFGTGMALASGAPPDARPR